MKLHKKIKIEKACAQSDRPVLVQPFLSIDDKGRGEIVASDGHIIAVVPVEVAPGDTSGPVYTEALVYGRKGGLPSAPLEVACTPDNVTTRGTMVIPRASVNYPNFKVLFPDDANNTLEIRLDSELLSRLCAALGTRACRLLINPKEPSAPILVRPLNIEASPALNIDARGLLARISGGAK